MIVFKDEIAALYQTKDQYIVWKAKKIEEDPDFFKKGSSIFMEEVAQLTKMAGSEPKAAGISKAGEFSIASLLPALVSCRIEGRQKTHYTCYSSTKLCSG